VSDQDFFFDEDEQPKTAEKATVPAKKSGSGGTPTRPPAADGQSVTMTVAVLIGVVTMLLGVIIGLFIGRGMATPAVVAPVGGTGTGTTPQAAPQLSPEQLEGGELPEGHPDIGGGGTGGSTETTGN